MNEELKLTQEVIEKAKLVEKYLDGNLTDEETTKLDNWISESPENKELFETLTNKTALSALMKEYYEAHTSKDDAQKRANEMTFGVAPAVVRPMYNFLKRMSVAAAVMVVVGVGGYIWYSNYNKVKPVPHAQVKPQQQHDVSPGKYSAMLTLADGSQVALDSTAGTFAQQGNASLVSRDGKLVYEKGKERSKEVLYNTLTTSKGEMYGVTLNDGTKVWLNSASSIHYAVIFTGSERKVVITGEAYFEVAKNRDQPFIVQVKGMEVEVLGTHFNVNSYADEPAMKTTLLEGKVGVRSAATNAQTILEPGEQAILQQTGDNKMALVKTKDVDVDAEVAWRFGYFNFSNTDFRTLMRQLERWYDVEVVYQGDVPDVKSFGEIPRELSLSQVLNALQRPGVHFKVVDKKIVVLP
jgi:transmembrane sensor